MYKSESPNPCGVIILAAGLGKRMKSPLPKVLHKIAGKPLLFHVLNRVQEVLPHASVALVVGHGKEQVESYIQEEPLLKSLKIIFITQAEQKGTGHAARCAMDSAWGDERVREKASILVLPGDLPLIAGRMIEQMVARLTSSEAIRLLTCELQDPTGYGRVVRKGKAGSVVRIVEEKDASLREKGIREVAASIYLFQAVFLRDALKKLSNKNAQGEYYLTDVIAQAIRSKKKVPTLKWNVPEDLRGVNDPWELAQANQILNQRVVQGWAVRGVHVMDPFGTWIDVTVQLNEGVKIHPGVILRGDCHIGKNVEIGPRVVLNHMQVGERAFLKTGTIGEHSEVGPDAQIGPYAHLRPESIVGSRAKIGNFVELKKSRIGENTSIAHLSYVGDAEVGKNVNIGCGFVTCNYDGRIVDGQRKHRTIIEDDVFLGSDCQTIAPVKVGRGAYVASGSTINQDVEPEALAIARSRQVNKPGYARKLKPAREE